ncbi:MAG: hypothetical protein ACRDG4_12750, partial [Chloroflexota bacterium]
VGPSLDMKHSTASFAPDASRIFCKANAPHVPKGTVLTIRFQQLPSNSDYYTHPIAVGAAPLYAYVYGPLAEGQWRCKVDMPGGTLGSAYFRVQ